MSSDIHVLALVPAVVCIRTCSVAFKQKPPHMS